MTMTNEEKNKCAEEIAVILDKYLSGVLDKHPVQDLEVINNCIEHYDKRHSQAQHAEED